MPPFAYKPIATDSNLLPIAIVFKREGVPLPAVGSIVTVTVKEGGSGDVIVQDAEATPHATIPGRWEFWFTPEQVGAIDSNTQWQVEWKVESGEYTWRSPEPATIIVRKKL